MPMSRGPKAGRDEKGCLRPRMVRRAALRKSQGRTRLARKGAQYSIQDAVLRTMGVILHSLTVSRSHVPGLFWAL